jgi:hypothetical protein
MDKSQFTKRLYDQFKAIITDTENYIKTEIESRRTRVDPASFLEWLVKERDKALDEPDLMPYDRVQKKWMHTPEGAAETLTQLIAFDSDNVVDWDGQLKESWPILSNHKPETADHWKYKTFFTVYLKATKADIRAKVFSLAIQAENDVFSQPSNYEGLDDGRQKSYQIRLDVSKGGANYTKLFNDYKSLHGLDAMEQDFLLDDIEFCKEEIEKRKNSLDKFSTLWVGLLKENIRAHEARLKRVIAGTKGNEKTELPPLADAFKNPEILPDFWKTLSEIDSPFVDAQGKILGNGTARRHREVMAIAQLITSKLTKADIGLFDVYTMLCKSIGLIESKRPDKISNRGNYEKIRIGLMADLKRFLT